MDDKKTIHLVAAEFYPAYRGGRVERMRALAEYLHAKEVQAQIHTFSLRSMVAPQFRGTKVTSYFSASPCQKKTTEAPKMTATRGWLTRVFQKIEGTPFLWDRYMYFVFCAIPRLRSVLKSGDTVIISCPWFSPLLFAAYLLVTNSKVRVVVDYRDLWDGGPFHLTFGGKYFQQMLQRYVLQRADLVTTTSQGQAEALAIAYEVQPLVVSNGIRGSDVRMIDAARMHCSSLTSQASDVSIGYFGSVGGQRNLSLQLKQLTSLRTVRSVCVCGDWSGIEQPSDKIHRRGFLTGELLGRELMRMDFLFISISAGEGAKTAIPSKLFLYMATGKPLIVSAPTDSELLRFLRGAEYPFALLEEIASDVCLWEAFRTKISWGYAEPRPIFILRDLEFDKLMEKIAQW